MGDFPVRLSLAISSAALDALVDFVRTGIECQYSLQYARTANALRPLVDLIVLTAPNDRLATAGIDRRSTQLASSSSNDSVTIVREFYKRLRNAGRRRNLFQRAIDLLSSLFTVPSDVDNAPKQINGDHWLGFVQTGGIVFLLAMISLRTFCCPLFAYRKTLFLGFCLFITFVLQH